MTSTVATVRTAITNAIAAIGASSLGLDIAAEAAREYLPEFEEPSALSAYFKSKVAGKNVIRKWAVQVLPQERQHSLNYIFARSYFVTVRAFYAIGLNGAGTNLMIDHFTKVQGAIKSLTNNLSGTVDRLVEIGPLNLSTDGTDDGRMVVGTIVYTFEKVNPDY